MNLNDIIQKVKFWYKNSRPYSIPITFLSWLVIFIYSLKNDGNALFGLIAFVGISLTHLATNLADDYFDYKKLCENPFMLESTKPLKCKYLKEGYATIEDLRNVVFAMLGFAAVCGVILFFTSGWLVAVFALIALFISIFYSKLSSNGLGDIAVVIAYGPLMFEGVYYVMTGELSFEVLILSFACAMFVEAILYAHMLMDFDEDVTCQKNTLCTILKTKPRALNLLMIIYVLGYIFLGIFSQIADDNIYLISYLTMPMVYELYVYLEQYNEDKTNLPEVYPWHYPLDNWETAKNTPNAPFLFRFMYARNISTYFMVLVSIAAVFS